MEELNKTNQPTWLNEMMQRQANRIISLVDILYLTNVTWLYFFSVIYPLFGIIFGIILINGSVSDTGKKIGRICLILGIINVILSVLIVVALIFIVGVFSKFNPYYL